MGEQGYALYMEYAARAEEIARVEANLPSGMNAQLEALLKQAEDEARELVKTQPNHWRAIDQRLRDDGYSGWEAEKLMHYASFLQARGWEAFYPDDVEFLRQKYGEAGLDPLTIDFSL